MTTTSLTVGVISSQEKLALLASTVSWQGQRLKTGSLLVAINPCGSKQPFFCVGLEKLVHHLGDLDVDQPIYALPCWILPQESTTYVYRLAAHYVQEIRAVQPNGPYLLGGYCLGGLIAFEIAQQLQAQDQKVALLTLVNTPAPLPRYLRIIFHYISRSAYHWRKFLQIEANKRLKYIFELVNKPVKQRIVNKFEKNNTELHKNYRYLVLLGCLEAEKNYVGQAYLGKVALLFGSEDECRCLFFPRSGWSEIIVDEPEIYIVPGNHENIFEEPYVQELTKKLKACLLQHTG